MKNMQWWASAVRELSEDTLEQVTGGLGYVSSDNGLVRFQKITEMHDMAVAELGRRSKAEEGVRAGQELSRTGNPYPRTPPRNDLSRQTTYKA